MDKPSTRPKLHYHTDCAYFAGCENMLPRFFASDDLRSQYDVTFSYRYSKRYAEGLKQRVVNPDFPIFALSFPDILDFTLLPSNLPVLVRRMIFLAQRLLLIFPLLVYEIWAFYRLMRKIKPDLVHVNNGGYPGALSARAAAIGAKLAGVPAVLMFVNNMAVGYKLLFRWLDYPVDRAVVRSVNKFLTGSAAASERLTEVLGIPKTRSISINHGISFTPSTSTVEETRKSIGLANFDGVIFGIVAVLGPRKGHQILFKAAMELLESRKQDMPRFKIVIVGEGHLRSDLEGFVRDNGLSDHCIFVGQRSDVMSYIAMIDVLVLPSIENEDFPFVVLEAMSHGKPVVASKVAGTVEQIVHQKTGFLVEPGDPAQLASALHEIASSSELRRQMGAAGRDYFLEHFTSEIAVRKYLSLYSLRS